MIYIYCFVAVILVVIAYKCIHKEKIKPILVISDIHYALSESEEVLLRKEYSQVWLLGDIPKDILSKLPKMECPILGVCGNHDTADTFDTFNIVNMHGANGEYGGLRIAGLAGSSRYKKSDTMMLTQDESEEIASRLESADVLISHDSCYQAHSTDMNKEGLRGISNYLDEHQPKLHIYGHHHQYAKYKRGNTTCMCIYRMYVLTPNEMRRIGIGPHS